VESGFPSDRTPSKESRASHGTAALHLIENGYFNGESVRLDGAIRLPPR
jgi:hypothetical protein